MTGEVLAIDLGGTKILATLVEGARILDRREVLTDRDACADRWVAQAAELAAPWAGRFARAGLAVTGVVADGAWRSTNPGTLDVPGGYPLAARAAAALGVAPSIANDAQAAAWGEFRHGAGKGRDMVFLTVSTGIGGGVVLGGRLHPGRMGLAGHAGLLTGPDGGAGIEEMASGRWMAAEAGRLGHDTDARGVFAAAARGLTWGETIVDTSARRIAGLCRNLQCLMAPEVIVIGGGVGLAAGYLDRLRAHVAALPDLFRPEIAAAALSADSGVIGIAALAAEAAGDTVNQNSNQTGRD